MAKYFKSISLDAPYDVVQSYCIEAAESLDWFFEKKADGHILLKEKTGCMFLMFHNPAKVEIVIQREMANKTKCDIKVTNFGFALNTIFVNKIGEQIHSFIIRQWADEALQKTLLDAAVENGLACPTCHAELPPGLKFCPNDGTPIGKECSKCKMVNMPSAQFCMNCGQSV